MYKYALLNEENIVTSVSEHSTRKKLSSSCEMDMTESDYDLCSLLGKKWTGQNFIDVGQGEEIEHVAED